jgi:hypothetical protein
MSLTSRWEYSVDHALWQSIGPPPPPPPLSPLSPLSISYHHSLKKCSVILRVVVVIGVVDLVGVMLRTSKQLYQ